MRWSLLVVVGGGLPRFLVLVLGQARTRLDLVGKAQEARMPHWSKCLGQARRRRRRRRSANSRGGGGQGWLPEAAQRGVPRFLVQACTLVLELGHAQQLEAARRGMPSAWARPVVDAPPPMPGAGGRANFLRLAPEEARPGRPGSVIAPAPANLLRAWAAVSGAVSQVLRAALPASRMHQIRCHRRGGAGRGGERAGPAWHWAV